MWSIAVILSALLYRFGGMSKEEVSWVPIILRKSWIRDWVIPLVCYGYMLTLQHPFNLLGWLLLIPTIALTGGAISTYWDKLFGKDNFYAHGFMIGLAAFPLIWAGVAWWLILIRALAMGLGMGLWCRWFSNVWVEECGRGAFIAANLPLLVI